MRGLLRTNRGILLLAASPILDGNGNGPTHGMVMLGRLLTPAAVRSIGAQAQSDLSMLTPTAGAATDDLVETEGVTRVSRTYRDIYGRPLMTLRVDVPREITARGRTAVAYASSCLIGGGGHRAGAAGRGPQPRDPAPARRGNAPRGGARQGPGPHHAVSTCSARTNSACWRASSTAWWSGVAQSRSAARRSVVPSRASPSSPRACCTTSATRMTPIGVRLAKLAERLRAAAGRGRAAGGRRAAAGRAGPRSAARTSRSSCGSRAASWRSR